MYQNLHKRKYYGIQFNPYAMMPTPSQVYPMPLNQKLHTSAPPFVPTINFHNEGCTSETTANDTNVVESPKCNEVLATSNRLLETEKMVEQCLQTPKPLKPYPGEDDVAGYHPLQNIWTMWYLETDRSKTWEEMQNEISSVDNVEDFWRLYNHIKPASELKTGCDYSLFKRSIRPMWEDEANRNGGRWVINLSRNISKEELDSLWLDVMLCLIGGTFEHSDHINGAVVNVRSKNNKISVWTKDGENEKAILDIGYKLREILRLAPMQLNYQLHKDTIAKTGSIVRSAYTI